MRSYLMRSYLMRLLKVLGSVLIVFLVAYARNSDLALLNMPSSGYRMAMVLVYLMAGWVAWLCTEPFVVTQTSANEKDNEENV